MRGRTNWQKLRETFHNSQEQRQQVVVQSSSLNARETVSQKMFAWSLKGWGSIARVAPRGYALIDVENQSLRAKHPVALAVLAYDFLRQSQRAVLRLIGFFLVEFGLVYLDQGRAPPGRVI